MIYGLARSSRPRSNTDFWVFYTPFNGLLYERIYPLIHLKTMLNPILWAFWNNISLSLGTLKPPHSLGC